MIKSEKEASRLFYLFLLIFLLVSIWGMYATPLFDEDEGFFAEAARKMVETGDFITIRVNGEERYDKPSLFFWLEALSIKLFGGNEFAVRLPSFLFFALLLRIVFNYAKRHYSLQTARLTVGILAGIFQFQLLSKAAVTDNLLNYFLAASMFSYLDFHQTKDKKKLLLFYVFCGLGFLTKGPVAWLIPGITILLYHILRGEFRNLLSLLNPVGILLCFLIPLLWFYPAFLASGEFLLTDFFVKHNLNRFSATMESHGGHIWFYFPVLLVMFMPFLHLFDKKILDNFKSGDSAFFILWFLVVFVLFSFSKTQLPHYISYGYVPLAILMAKTHSEKSTLGYKIQTIFILFLFVLLPYAITKINLPNLDAFSADLLANVPDVFDTTYFLIQLTLLIGLILLFTFRKKDPIYLPLAVVSISFSFFVFTYARLQQGFVKEVGLSLDKEVFMTDHYNPSLSFYAQKSLPISEELKSGTYYFIRKDKLKESEMKILKEGSGFALVYIP